MKLRLYPPFFKLSRRLYTEETKVRNKAYLFPYLATFDSNSYKRSYKIAVHMGATDAKVQCLRARKTVTRNCRKLTRDHLPES